MTNLNFTILIVDDDPDDVEILNEAIHSINSSIICLMANNGRAALNLLNQLLILPQIIFMDFNMPQMNGGLCLSQIKNDERLKNIPVVMYSTFFSEQNMKEFKQEGAYLVKKQIEFKAIIQSIVLAIKNFYPELKTNL